MTRTLLLHIGSHKTGTTSIQVALRRAQRDKVLEKYNYLHARPRVDFNPLISCSGMGAKLTPYIRWPFLNRRIADANERSLGDCIISTEMLFWLSNPPQIERLAQRLREHFDDIRVIAYLRRQDLLAVSHRKQVVLGRAAYQFYGSQLKALPDWRPHMMRYFDYAAKISMWEEAFGADKVTVRRFQKGDLVGGDTALDFFDWAGLPTLPAQDRQNTAMSRNALMAGLRLRQDGYARGAIVHALKDLDPDEALRPGAAAARKWMDRFAEINARLATRYDPDGPPTFFDMDFSSFPDRGNAIQPSAEEFARLKAKAEAFQREHDLPFEPCHPGDKR